MKIRRIVIVLLVMLSVVMPAGAQTVYLKDGRVVTGKIISRSASGIVVQEGSMPRHYYNDQVLRIEENQPSVAVEQQKKISLDSSRFSDIVPEKFGLIIQMIEVSGVRHNMQVNIDNIISSMPDDQRDQVKTFFNIDEIVAQIVPIYDKYYTAGEINEIIAFYKTPAGQKMIEVTPKIMQEALDASVNYFKDVVTP